MAASKYHGYKAGIHRLLKKANEAGWRGLPQNEKRMKSNWGSTDFTKSIFYSHTKRTVACPQPVFADAVFSQSVHRRLKTILCRSPGLWITARCTFPVSQWYTAVRSPITVAGPLRLFTWFPLSLFRKIYPHLIDTSEQEHKISY